MTMSIGAHVKTIKEEDLIEDVSRVLRGQGATERPFIEITKCISFQKFRYTGEQRPGKKYQDKDFVTLKLNNLKDKVVRVFIMCINADNVELIHPNGLIGAHCNHGIYVKEYAITKPVYEIEIPYIRIERMKTKKTDVKQIKQIMDVRVCNLPSPYKERCHSQCSQWAQSPNLKFNTAKVRLAVFVTLENDPGNLNGTLHAASNVICNGSEKTELSIHKLSSYTVPARSGGCIDIFTTENGPDIEPDNYFLQVSYESKISQINWESEKYLLEDEDVLYKRVISYNVPPFEPALDLVNPVTATLHLQCPDSNLHCTKMFDYVPQPVTQIITGTSDSQDDMIYHGDQMLGMSSGVNSSSDEITTNGGIATLHTYKPINVQNFSMIKSEESVLQLENHSTNVAPEGSGNLFNYFVCTSNEGDVKQIGAHELSAHICKYVCSPARNEKENASSSSGQDEQNKLIMPGESSASPTLDSNTPAQVTQSVMPNEIACNIAKYDLSVDDQLRVQELPSSIDNIMQNVDNRNKFKYISLGFNNMSNSESYDRPSASQHDSESAPSLRMIPLARINTACKRIISPWQLEESDNSAADSSLAEKRLKP